MITSCLCCMYGDCCKIIHIINFKYPTKEFLSLIDAANLPQIAPKCEHS